MEKQIRKKAALLVLVASIFLISCQVEAVNRGIKVVAKGGEQIYLYKDYHALVVGVGDYTHGWPDLPNAIKDAKEVSVALKQLGVKVKLLANPTSLERKNALNNFTYEQGREKNRALIFYYAGHGETEALADNTKLGYIIPQDCPLLKDDPKGFVNKATSMKDIETYSLRIRSKHVLMLFDSCFSGSLFSLVRAAPEDICEKSILPVRQYITAGMEDEPVPDRSMFKRCLLLGLQGDADLTRDGYITGSELGMYLSDKVIQYTKRRQHPQYGKINNPDLDRGDFIFQLASSGAIIEEPARKKNKTTFSIKCNISRAKVLLDNRNIGSTPLSIMDVSPGEYSLRVEKDGYEPYQKRVYFEAGRTMSMYVDLNKKRPTTGRLFVETKPNDARVKILNIVPKFYQSMELDPGKYHLEVSAAGYETKKKWVKLNAGKTTHIYTSLVGLQVVDETCAACHATQVTEMRNYPSKHKSEVACVDCHKKCGQMSESECYICHESHSPYIGLDSKNCLECHPAHTPMKIAYGMKTPSVICGSCHATNYDLLQSNHTKHTELTCTDCHNTHRLIHRCSDCHGLFHSEMMQDLSKCADCHGTAHNLRRNM